jgi:hypothetical protein
MHPPPLPYQPQRPTYRLALWKHLTLLSPALLSLLSAVASHFLPAIIAAHLAPPGDLVAAYTISRTWTAHLQILTIALAPLSAVLTLLLAIAFFTKRWPIPAHHWSSNAANYPICWLIADACAILLALALISTGAR